MWLVAWQNAGFKIILILKNFHLILNIFDILIESEM